MLKDLNYICSYLLQTKVIEYHYLNSVRSRSFRLINYTPTNCISIFNNKEQWSAYNHIPYSSTNLLFMLRENTPLYKLLHHVVKR